MAPQKVLIVGAGVSGSIVAYFLSKSDFEITVIERAKEGSRYGQGIEIQEPALQVVKTMGIIDRLNAVKTGEKGFQLVDEHDRVQGSFDADKGLSLTGSLEMMRGDLTQVLYKAANEAPNVTYHFETTIQSVSQTPDKVTVELQNRATQLTRSEEYDLVVGADGARSRTRDLVLGPPDQINCFKQVGAYSAFFSIPKQPRDYPYSKACNFPARRVIWMRPVGEHADITSVHCISVGSDNTALDKAIASGDRQAQKAAFAELYAGLGWEAPRVVEAMLATDNFYGDKLVQVKLDRWAEGRVVLVGDAAWAPTPFSGEGNQLAIMGAWVLAQELTRDGDSVAAAFKRYEERLREYVEKAQELPMSIIRCLLPQTAWGIWLLRKVFFTVDVASRIAAWTGLSRLFPEHEGSPAFNLQMTEADREKVV